MKAKLVNERLGFTQDGDPVEDMGIGWSVEKAIKKRLHDEGDPVSYENFMAEWEDRYGNQDTIGILEDLERVISALEEEPNIAEISHVLDQDDNFVDEIIALQIKLLSKLSVEKQMQWYEPILDSYINMMKH